LFRDKPQQDRHLQTLQLLVESVIGCYAYRYT